jgi:hypothetical protein
MAKKITIGFQPLTTQTSKDQEASLQMKMDWDARTCGVRRFTLLVYGSFSFVVAAILADVIVALFKAPGANQPPGRNRLV